MRTTKIEPATLADLPGILAAYDAGRTVQRAQASIVWPIFTDDAIAREIASGVLFRVVDESVVTGVFSMIDEDALIWGDEELGAHLYLHRIARAATLKSRGLVDTILTWARGQCQLRGRAGLRMDTWASNHALIAYYAARGFQLVGTRMLPGDPRLAPHYHGIELALLELACAGGRTHQ